MSEMLQRPYRLVPDALPHDTVECLEQLLRAARNGQVQGLGIVAMLKGRQYLVETTGEVHRNPTFARGMVGALEDKISRLMGAGGG
jgi:hypothetical protein